MSNLLTSRGTDTAKTGTNMSTLLTEIIEICKDGATATRTAEQFAEMYSHKNSVFTYKGSPVVNVDVSSGFAFEVFEKSNGSPVLQGYSVNGRAIVTGTTTALGGDSLPEVSATDNGDVLGVVEGEWAKTEIPTPSVEVLNFTMGESGAVSELTAGEILALANAGKSLLGRVEVTENFVMQLQIGQVAILENKYSLGVIAATDNGQAPICLFTQVDNATDHFTITMS